MAGSAGTPTANVEAKTPCGTWRYGGNRCVDRLRLKPILGSAGERYKDDRGHASGDQVADRYP